MLKTHFKPKVNICQDVTFNIRKEFQFPSSQPPSLSRCFPKNINIFLKHKGIFGWCLYLVMQTASDFDWLVLSSAPTKTIKIVTVNKCLFNNTNGIYKARSSSTQVSVLICNRNCQGKIYLKATGWSSFFRNCAYLHSVVIVTHTCASSWTWVTAVTPRLPDGTATVSLLVEANQGVDTLTSVVTRVTVGFSEIWNTQWNNGCCCDWWWSSLSGL